MYHPGPSDFQFDLHSASDSEVPRSQATAEADMGRASGKVKSQGEGRQRDLNLWCYFCGLQFVISVCFLLVAFFAIWELRCCFHARRTGFLTRKRNRIWTT